MARTGNDSHKFENAALMVLALIVASIAAYAFLTRPDSRGKQDVDLERTMPGDYKPVLAALIRATGQECDKVCSATIAEAALGERRVRVACAVEARHISCAQAVDIEIVVSPTPQPSR